MQIILNGAAYGCEAPFYVAELIAKLELAGMKVAVEKNGEIVPKSEHARTPLADGDRLEIVVAVGGG